MKTALRPIALVLLLSSFFLVPAAMGGGLLSKLRASKPCPCCPEVTQYYQPTFEKDFNPRKQTVEALSRAVVELRLELKKPAAQRSETKIDELFGTIMGVEQAANPPALPKSRQTDKGNQQPKDVLDFLESLGGEIQGIRSALQGN